jgi:beta-galactosidase beta subunit
LTKAVGGAIMYTESEGTIMKNAIIRFLLKKTYIDVKTLVVMLEKIKYSTTEQERKYYWEKV